VMPFKAECAERYLRRLPDFTEYRLPEIDEAGIDLQVLSLTVPGMQVNIPTGSAPSRVAVAGPRGRGGRAGACRYPTRILRGAAQRLRVRAARALSRRTRTR